MKFTSILLLITLFISNQSYGFDESELPPEFQGYKWNSTIKISYEDITQLYDAFVVDMGMSGKKKLKRSRAKTGTRLNSNRKLYTALEANRFYYENFKDEETKVLLTKIRKSLEQVSNEVAINQLKEKEQLAYWLNLYNITVLEQLVLRYPIKNLEDEILDDDSFLDEKLLTISGHKLSLNYIHHKIIIGKFGKNKDVIYGLYQGNIGSPNIRKEAYTADKVVKQLEANATEFINSNRGVFKGKKNKLRISKFYEQNQAVFPNFKEDFTKHILYYANGPIRDDIQNAKSFKMNIENWTITDVFGSVRTYGASINNNGAAMLDSVNSSQDSNAGEGFQGSQAVNMGFIAGTVSEKTVDYGRFSADQLELLQKMNDIRLKADGSVTITDIEEDNQ